MAKQAGDLLARERGGVSDITNLDSLPAREPADPSWKDGPLCRRALAGTMALTLVSVTLSFVNRHWQSETIFKVFTDWLIWLAILHASGMIGLLWRHGRPVTLPGWACLLVFNIWLLGVEYLHMHGELDAASAVAADLLLRVAVIGMWGVACLGFPFVLAWIRRHRHAPRPAFLFGRLWFSTLILLITAEPMMAYLEREEDVLSLQERLPDPPADELRIISIGSSTMVGFPYDPKFGIPQVVAWRLQQLYPHRKVVSENLALPGLNLRQAIERLQGLQYRPHLLLMYSGHNEFLHDLEELAAGPSLFGALDGILSWSPTFRVLNLRLRRNRVLQSMVSGVGPGLVKWPITLPEIFERRRQRFRRNLVQLANFARSRGIAMLWYIPAASESGYEPNRSVVDPHTLAADVAALNRCFAEGTDRERLEDWTGAAECYRAGLARAPQFAEFHFRLGECLLQQGQTDEARRHFQDALDFDGHPVRLPQPYRQVIAEVGSDFSIPVVFTGEALRRHTPTGILDKSLFHDNVHPTLRGFYYMGVAGVDVLEKSGLLESQLGRPAEIPAGEFADALRETKLDRMDLAKAHRGIANGLRWLGLYRFDATRRKEQADRYLHIAELLEAGEIDPGDEGTEALP